MPYTQVPNRPYSKLLDWLRYICAFLLYMYGTSKLIHLQFHLQTELAQQPIGSLNGYQLTFYYYGFSRTYASILGILQLIGATLLLFPKSTLIGAAIVTPMMANIWLINIFYLVGDYGPQFTSTLILGSMLAILWHQRTALFSLFWANQPIDTRRMHHWIRALILLAVVLIMGVGSLIQSHVKKLRGADHPSGSPPRIGP